MSEQKGLDRPKLREKIADWLIETHFAPHKFYGARFADREYFKKEADQILALIPDIEEAKRLAFEDGYTKGQQHSIGTDTKLVEEAKKQERERILDKIDELSNDGEFFLTPQEIRQALKETE